MYIGHDILATHRPSPAAVFCCALSTPLQQKAREIFYFFLKVRRKFLYQFLNRLHSFAFP